MYQFMESQKLDKALAAKADVILLHLQDMDVKESLRMLASCRGRETELILLAGKDQLQLLPEEWAEIQDIWTMPISDDETRFRFMRWQQACRMSIWMRRSIMFRILSGIRIRTAYMRK